MKKKEKPITIKEYLNGLLNDNLRFILSNLSLGKTSIDEFFEMYGVMSPEEVAEFVLNPKNSFKLGLFGHRTSGSQTSYAYNGKGIYIDINGSIGRSTINVRGSLDRS